MATVQLNELTDFDSPHPGVVAIAVARSWFRKLCSEGTLPAKRPPVPVDADQVDLAMMFLCNVGRTKRPAVFSNKLAGDISQVVGREISNGATIAACVALGLTVRTWYGVRAFAPDVLLSLSCRDCRRGMGR